ncbi:MAG: ABC transporter ATP-binding protein [Pseudomonadota bacterium]
MGDGLPPEPNQRADLELKGLAKAFNGVHAVDRLSLKVGCGDVVGVLGPNGAGKSTTMRMIAGVIAPDAGDALIAGHSIVSDRRRAQAALGYLPEGAPLYLDMTPPEFLRFVGRSRAMKRKPLADAIERVTADARIGPVMGKRLSDLSKGYRRRVGLAAALVGDPPVLLLDEPTDGLDPNQKRAVRALISRMAATKAILITTHTLEEVPAMCTRVVVINDGRIVADDTPAGLADQSPDGGLERVFSDLTAPMELAAQ